MRKVKKRISLFLAVLLTLSLVPASVLSSAAAGAYQVLFEPSSQLQDGFISGAYGDIGLVLNVNTNVYRIVRFTGSGLEYLPGEYDRVAAVGGGYIIVGDADADWNVTYSVIDTKGTKVLDLGDTYYFDKIDESGLAKGANNTNGTYCQIDLNTHKTTEITRSQYYGDNGITYRYDYETGKYNFIDANDDILFGGYDDISGFYDGYAWVSVGDVHQVIDTTGKAIISDTGKDYMIDGWLFSANGMQDGLIYVRDRETWQVGLANMSGEIVVPTEHEWVSDVAPDGTVWVWDYDLDNNTGYSAILKVNGGSAPVTPVQPDGVQAMPTNDTLRVNGEIKNATVYKIDGSNYFKIRDLAAVLNSTSKQFAVGYDGESKSVTATTGQPYQLAGGELAGAAPSVQTATVSNDTIIVNGSVAENVTVYKIDGSNYFKLRDLGAALGFDVGWSQEEGMFINTEA